MRRSNDIPAKEGADGQFSMAREIDSLPFTYSRSVEGYGWQEGRFSGLAGRVQKGPLLVALSRHAEPTPPPRPDLFIRFVRLDPKSLDDIRDFAGEYGFLRGGFLFRRLPSQSASLEGTSANEAKAETYVGETHAQWEADILKMQAAYQLHKAIRGDDIEELKKAITWEGKRITYRGPERISPAGYKIQDSFEIAIDHKPGPEKEERIYRAELFKRLRPGDFIMPARIALQDLINARMAELVTPPQLRWVHNFKRMGEFAVPKCLLGHLWRQLAAALCSFSTIRDCEECGEPMVISPRASEEAGRRRSRRTCSPACRVKRSEKRKRETLRLHRQGLSDKEITAQVDSGLDQIKRWIKGDANRHGARRS